VGKSLSITTKILAMPNMTHFLNEAFPKPISINLNGTRHSFKNFAKYQEWAMKQIKFYQAIGNPGNIQNTFNQRIVVQVENIFNSNRPDEYNFNNLHDDLKGFLESTFARFGLIDYASNEGKWLTKQVSINPNNVAVSAQYFISKNTNPNGNAQRDGELAAYLFDKGYDPDFETEKQKYEEFYSNIVQDKDELIEEIKRLKTEHEEILKLSKEQKTWWAETFDKKLEDVKKNFNEEADRHDIKMKESEEFYEKKLAVKNAVVYWTEKAIEHKRNSWIFGSIAGILMIGVLIAIVCIGKYFVGLDLTNPNGVGSKLLTKSGALQLWVYGFFIISVTMIIWIIRLLVKVFLSNLHQLSDANERATMIQTYLAFEREEKTLTEKDKELVLPSIFRTSSHGIIKEDSAPNTPMNIFMGKS
jgi:hypothetical protein